MDLYATLPPSWSADPSRYRGRAADIGRWIDDSDFRGLLVFTDHAVVDQWAAAQYLIERTENLVPLVAAQPAYMHPYTTARMVSTLGYLYGRQVDLNLVTGGNRNDLHAVGCAVEHDARYDRLVEYGRIVRALLTEAAPWSFHGRHYQINSAVLRPALPPDLMPRTFVAGSSEACVGAARALGAVRLTYPRSIEQYAAAPTALRGTGVRLGIIARQTSAAAWAIAHARYPGDRTGEQLRDDTVQAPVAAWHRQMLEDAYRQQKTAPDSAYWLYPFRSFKEYCPYLVGSYQEVGDILAGYLAMGVEVLIMAVPWQEDDLHHALIAIRRAESTVATPSGSPIG